VVWHLLPWHNALDVQRILAFAEDPLPVIFLSGHHDVHQSVEAMKAGAVDFLVMDESGETLVRAISRALDRNLEERTLRERRRELRARYDLLTRRERDVFERLVDGKPNKETGFELGISVQTTKIHRHRVLEKMQAASLVELARMADQLGLSAGGSVHHTPIARDPAGQGLPVSAVQSRGQTGSSLADTVAHELHQPLVAIRRNCEAATVMLRAVSPNLMELRRIVDDILSDERRAATIITRVQALAG